MRFSFRSSGKKDLPLNLPFQPIAILVFARFPGQSARVRDQIRSRSRSEVIFARSFVSGLMSTRRCSSNALSRTRIRH